MFFNVTVALSTRYLRHRETAEGHAFTVVPSSTARGRSSMTDSGMFTATTQRVRSRARRGGTISPVSTAPSNLRTQPARLPSLGGLIELITALHALRET